MVVRALPLGARSISIMFSRHRDEHWIIARSCGSAAARGGTRSLCGPVQPGFGALTDRPPGRLAGPADALGCGRVGALRADTFGAGVGFGGPDPDGADDSVHPAGGPHRR